MSSSKYGCGSSVIFVLIFIASLILNCALLTGCEHGKCPLCKWGNDAQIPVPHTYDATDDLREIANRLGCESEGLDAYEMASLIKTQLYVEPSAKGFPCELLTEQQIEEIKDRLPKKKAEIIGQYQQFIKLLDGKRFIIVP